MKIKRGFLSIFDNKFVKLFLIIVLIGVVSVFAGDVIVKEGNLDVEDDLSVGGSLNISSINLRNILAESNANLSIHDGIGEQSIILTSSGELTIKRNKTDSNAILLVKEGDGNTIIEVQADGRVGIGTTDQSNLVEIEGDDADTDYGTKQLRICSDDSPDNCIELGYRYDGGSIEYARAQGYSYDEGTTKPLILNPLGAYVGVKDVTPSQQLDVGGNVRADDFIEYSPFFVGDAVSAIKNINPKLGSEKDNWADVNHSSLPEGVKVEIEEIVFVNKKTGKVMDRQSPDDMENWDVITRVVEGRSLGSSVQLNLKAIQQLIDRVEELEKEVEELRGV